MSLNMLIEFGDAFDFTGRDFDGWCRKIAFRRKEEQGQACVSTDFRLRKQLLHQLDPLGVFLFRFFEPYFSSM